MGKKKKGKKGKKGTGEKKGKPVTDGLLPIDMSRKQLLGHTVRLQAELEREREERNFFMLEREKLYQRWNLIMEQIAIEKAKVRTLKSHLADSEDAKKEADDLFETKLRFLKSDQTRKLGQLRLLHLVQMAEAQDDAWAIHMILREELTNKKKEIRQAQFAFYQMLRGLHWAHARQVSDLRDEFAREIRRLESSFDRSLFENNEAHEEEQVRKLNKMRLAKEEQIRTIIDDHAWQVDQMKMFFQELLKLSLDIVNQMKQEVKQQTTSELMQRRDYEHFKHRYDVYMAPAMRWATLMEEWTEADADENVDELVSTLKFKEMGLKKRKHAMRMLEASNEALNQRLIIAEGERNCVKKQFCRAIVDSQRTTSMKRFCQQLRKKVAVEESEVFKALNQSAAEGGQNDYFSLLMVEKDKETFEHVKCINEQAAEHQAAQYVYADAFLKNEINLADLGFPVQTPHVKPAQQQDLETAIDMELSRRQAYAAKQQQPTAGPHAAYRYTFDEGPESGFKEPEQEEDEEKDKKDSEWPGETRDEDEWKPEYRLHEYQREPELWEEESTEEEEMDYSTVEEEEEQWQMEETEEEDEEEETATVETEKEEMSKSSKAQMEMEETTEDDEEELN